MSVLGLLAALAVLVWPASPVAPRHPAAGRGRPPQSHAAHLRPRGRPTRGLWCGLTARAGTRLGVGDLADLVETLVPQLRAGVGVPTAVAITAEAVGDRDGLSALAQELAAAARDGDPLAGVWARHRQSSALPEVAFLARAWALSEQSGVPLADALSTVAAVLRSRQAAQRALQAATAGARASMSVLTLLPLVGPAIGLLFGLSPVDLYGRSPAATVSLVTGVVLGGLGWAWSRAILRRALRPEPVS